MATHYCDECVHFDFEPMDFEKPCKKGHAPKFFLPKNDDYGSIDWGWKRNCDDFRRDISCTRNLTMMEGG